MMTVMSRFKYLLILALLLGAVILPSRVIAAQEIPPPGTPPTAPVDTSTDVTGLTQGARDLITQALYAYRRGEFQNAYKFARSSYLDYFENAEPPLRLLNRDLTLDMEFRFADVRSKMQLRRKPEEVEASVTRLREGLIEIDSMFAESGVQLAPMIAGTTSFLITIREGLEALLVIGIVFGALRAAGARGMGRYVLIGSVSAVLVSGAAWWLLHTLLRSVPVIPQLISAVASVIAVISLVWVNIWILRRLDQRYWLETMGARTWAALQTGSFVGVFLIGFSAVFRQGLEAALLYEVLISYSPRTEYAVLIGIGASLGVMLILTWGVVRAGGTLSPTVFLRIAAPILMGLSIAFIGGAVWQLQEAGYVNTTSAIKVIPRLPYFVATLTGIHPTWETVGAQIGLLATYVGLGVIAWWRTRWLRVEREPLPVGD
jgi:high-affinity iron transporter